MSSVTTRTLGRSGAGVGSCGAAGDAGKDQRLLGEHGLAGAVGQIEHGGLGALHGVATDLLDSFLDGLGNAAGYGWILIAVAFFRELLGSGTLLDMQVIPQAFYDAGYENNGMMILPPMALVVVGIIIWIQRSRRKDLIED